MATKQLLYFGFETPLAIGVIDETSFTVTVNYPFGTDVSALYAQFTHNGTGVQVAAVNQTSGVSVNSFESPVTYTVFAEDDTSQEYIVTVNVSATPDGDEDPVEWTLIDTDLTTVLSIIPAANDSSLYLELNEPGSGALKVPLLSNVASLFESRQFVRCYYRGALRGGFFIENINNSLANSGEGGDLFTSISGRGAMALLDDATVWPESNADTKESTRDFEAQKPAAVLITLIEEAKDRGALANLFYDFTAANDSTPAAWTDTENLSLTIGKSLLEVVREISEFGIEFRMVIETDGTFTLQAYKNEIGTNKAETVFLRRGVNCIDVSSTEAGGEIKNALLVKYDGGYASVSNPASIAASRRREGVIDSFSSFKPSTAVSFGNARLDTWKDPKIEVGVQVYDGLGVKTFLDYDMGDYLTLDMSGDENVYRVRNLQLSFGESERAIVTVGLNSTIFENDIRQGNEIKRSTEKIRRQHDASKLEVSEVLRIGKVDDVNFNVRAQSLIGDILYVGGAPGAGIVRMGGILSPSPLLSFNTLTGAWTNLLCPLTYVYCMIADGTDLYIGGYTTDVNSNNSVLKYDTLTGIYSALGGGVTGFFVVPQTCHVYALDIVNGVLFVGGDFNYADAANAPLYYSGGLAQWDIAGGTWGSVPLSVGHVKTGLVGQTGTCLALTHIDNILYVSDGIGAFVISEYDTTTDLGTQIIPTTGVRGGYVKAMAVYDTDKVLMAGGGLGGGDFGKIGLWDGSTFTTDFINYVNNDILTLCVIDDTHVYFGGIFTYPTAHVGQLVGGFVSGVKGGANGTVYSIINRADDISIGGSFTTMGGKVAVNIAVYITTFQSLIGNLENGAGANGFNMGEAIRSAPVAAITDSDKIGFWESAANALRSITWLSIKDTLFPPAGAVRMLLTNALGHPTTDARFYWDDSKGLIYLGGAGGVDALTTNATVLNLLAKADNTQIVQTMHSWGSGSTVFPLTAAYRSRGTKATPTAIQSGDNFYSASGFGHDGVAWITGSVTRFRLAATENWSATNHGAAVFFDGTPNASTTRREFGKVTELGFDVPAGSTYNINGSPISIHDAVTLDTNANTILSLSTQALGLDTQLANYIFAGATSGGAAVPAFRSLVAADIPSLSSVYVPIVGGVTITGAIKINTNSTTAFLVEQDGVKDNVLVVDTTNGIIGIGNTDTDAKLNIVDNGDYVSGLLKLQSSSTNARGTLARIGFYSYWSMDNSGNTFWAWGAGYNGTGNAWVRRYVASNNYLPYIKYGVTGTIGIGGAVSNLTTDTAPVMVDKFQFDVSTATLKITGVSLPGTVQLTNSSTTILSGNQFGSVDFYSNDPSGGGVGIRAQIKGIATEEHAGTSQGTAITFITSSTQAGGLVEAARIDKNGYFGIGGTPTSRLHVISTTDITQTIIRANSVQSAASRMLSIQNSSSTEQVYISGDYVLGTKGRRPATRTVTAATTMTVNDEVIEFNSATAITQTLIAATGTGAKYTFLNRGVGRVTLDGASTDLIHGSLTQYIDQYESFSIHDVASGIWMVS